MLAGIAVKTVQSGPGSPRATAEIDTRAPFQSVKAAVSLFGEAVSPRATTPVAKKSKAEERVLEKETQHQMMRRELDCYKDQLRNAENAKAQAQRELQRANRTLQELTSKLEVLNESKQASIKATEAAKLRVKELQEELTLRAQQGNDTWRADLDSERERYKACIEELTASKEELANLQQELDLAMVEKEAVFKKTEEAKRKAQINREKHGQLTAELAELCQSLEQVKHASLQAQEEHSKLIAEKEAHLLEYKSAIEEAEKEIECLKEQLEPTETLQIEHEKTIQAVRDMEEQLKIIKGSDLYSIHAMVLELANAKKALQEVIAERKSLTSSVDEMQSQLEVVKGESLESENKALEAETTVKKMQADLEDRKAELEAAVSGCALFMQASLEEFSAAAEKARHEAEDIEKNVEMLKQEAESARTAIQEAEEKLNIAIKGAEAAKAAEEKQADNQIHNSPRSDEAADLKSSGLSNRKIKLSAEEFGAMNKKIEGFKNEADVKVAAAMAQVETINANEKGISQKLEAVLKESEALQAELDDALSSAEMAEAAKRAAESELQKQRQNDRHPRQKMSECTLAKFLSI